MNEKQHEKIAKDFLIKLFFQIMIVVTNYDKESPELQFLIDNYPI